jgi:ABC-type transporter Mla subunit MlaD
MLLTGLAGACVSAVGIIGVGASVDAVGRDIDGLLAGASTSLANTRQSLLVLKAAVTELEDSAVTLGGSARESDRGLERTQEVIGEVAKLTGQDLPRSLGAVKQSVDSATKPAAAMDAVLTAITTTPPFSTALAQAGVSYKPEVSLATSLTNVATSLDGASARIRALEPSLTAARESVGQLRASNARSASDVARLRESLVRLEWILDGYVADLDSTQTSVRRTRESVGGQLAGVKAGVLLVSVWFGLAQLPALYLGWQLLRGRRMVSE